MQQLPKGHADENERQNAYYAHISRKLRRVKYLALLGMVLAAALTLFAYRGRITYDNLRYLLRDVDAAGHTVASSDIVYYPANASNAYLCCRGDLAVASTEGTAVYHTFSNRSFSDAVNFRAPLLVGSDKYMLVYDAGGYSVYVYNAISRVYSERFDYPIVDCAAADSGSFAVLLKNNVGGYIIRIYDKNFKLAATLTREGFVYSIGFLADGRLYLCESLAENAALCTEISFYTLGKDAIDLSIRENGIVLLVGQTKKGLFALSNSGLSFLDDRGGRIDAHAFGTAEIVYADANADGVCVLLDENASDKEYGAYAYLANGNTFSLPLQKGARGIALCKKRICVLYDDVLSVYDGSTSREIGLPVGARGLCAGGGSSVFVFYNDYAKKIDIQ